MDLLRTGSGSWKGDLRSGSGTASTYTGVVQDAHITFDSRFSDGGGTNPEELIAAAHAACFSMALANILSQKGFVPDEVKTTATLTLNKGEQGFSITKMSLDTAAVVPNIDPETFGQSVNEAAAGCPVSRLLIPGLVDGISVNGSLIQ
ncbi:MAG: OsmC family peroxiredoxin [Anaerolineae bacterium]